MLRPGNSIRAKAKPASVASTTVRITTLTVTTTLESM
jgi:hypothetical protein